jgi:hypothetical protein
MSINTCRKRDREIREIEESGEIGKIEGRLRIDR